VYIHTEKNYLLAVFSVGMSHGIAKQSQALIIVNATCQQFLDKAKDIDLPIIILHGNESMHIQSIIEKYISNKNDDIGTLKQSSYSYSQGGQTIEVEYYHSNYHFIIDYTDKHLNFIKHLMSHKSVIDRPMVIVLKNVDLLTKQQQLSLKPLLDKANNKQFLFITQSLSRMHEFIISRAACINCSFQTRINTVPEGLHKKLIELLNKLKTSKSAVVCIESIRTFVYKVYHMNVPLSWIINQIINHISTMKQTQKIYKLISDFAEIEQNKDILSYERVFLKYKSVF
jgi:hypothetical protein